MFKASLSQFMHGEQGAMITAAKLVEAVPWIDAKYYAATQTMDEARHTEVFAKYLDTKLGEAYPMSPFLEGQITALHRGQPVGHRVPRHADRDREPRARGVRRHAAPDRGAAAAPAAALRARPTKRATSRSACSASRSSTAASPRPSSRTARSSSSRARCRSRARATTPEVWERMGVDVDEVRPFLFEAAGEDRKPQGNCMGFQSAFFAKLVPNVRKLGLLDANDGYLRERWGEAGLMEFEFADDTGTDYTSYDEVAADRASEQRP